LKNDQGFSSGTQRIDLIVRFGDMSAKNSLLATIYEREWHEIRKKAAGPCRDESSKGTCADDRMQSL
jgi:hypothetical protein